MSNFVGALVPKMAIAFSAEYAKRGVLSLRWISMRYESPRWYQFWVEGEGEDTPNSIKKTLPIMYAMPRAYVTRLFLLHGFHLVWWLFFGFCGEKMGEQDHTINHRTQGRLTWNVHVVILPVKEKVLKYATVQPEKIRWTYNEESPPFGVLIWLCRSIFGMIGTEFSISRSFSRV